MYYCSACYSWFTVYANVFTVKVQSLLLEFLNVRATYNISKHLIDHKSTCCCTELTQTVLGFKEGDTQ